MAERSDRLTTEITGRSRLAWLSRSWPFIVTSLLTLLTLWLYSRFNAPPPLPSQQEIDGNIIAVMASATPPPAFSAAVYEQIFPSLVVIQVEGEWPEGESGFGIGSGVVVNGEGAILTALHVVSEATTIRVGFFDGTITEAVLATADPTNDIAVLQPLALPEVVVPAVLGSSAALRIGDEAFAVGNPLGLAGSMSAGVISGFNRSLPINERDSLDGLIQFDTAVNPGNSGGPLLNRQGQVVGIVTALANPSDQNFFIGIGFAVPIATAGGAAGAPNY